MQDHRSPAREFAAFPASGRPLRVVDHDGVVTVEAPGGEAVGFALSRDGGTLRPTSAPPADPAAFRDAMLAALEAVFAWSPERETVAVEAAGCEAGLDVLVASGVLARDDGRLLARADTLMQQPALWLARGDASPFPERFVLTGDRRHPLRRPKPAGVVYARHIPWLGETLTFRTATVEDDLDAFHRWMNDPRVAAFWSESGDLAHHRRYLEGLIADPHMVPMIGAFDGVPFAWFEIYWAKENRLGPFYDADDYDRGWHVAVGEASRRGGASIGAWLPSLVHFMLLDDPRTRRIVGEPAASHVQQIRNLERSGFARLKTFDFPHKRAALVSLSRERFFADRLWLPASSREAAAPAEAASPLPLAGAA
ncbi:MAG: acetyltransferase [Ancylobacter novellus]|uniref:Acetyltransferase n=1 Tax=Ancylobacter novellus TaxID=921 RepID=A0A2W5LZW1_ANCNO|nr:MAG: acetyltransferase [Ancylobacter novellus]